METDCEIAYHSPSFAAADELTMARIAALSGAGSFTHDSTTESKPRSASPELREAIGEGLSEFPNESPVFRRFEPCSAHHSTTPARQNWSSFSWNSTLNVVSEP